MSGPGSLSPASWCIDRPSVGRRPGFQMTERTSHQKGFNPHLAFGEVAVTDRDIEMLRAIDQHGSMHQAANELGRSYSHLQRRVVELEGVIGQLLRRFERLRVELSGVTTVPEAVISGTVVEQDGELATVRTAAGDLLARVPASSGDVEVAVRADAVVLMEPESASHVHTSLRNQLTGVVRALEIDDNVATVTVDVGGGVEITSIVTAGSVDRLGLEEGDEVIAAFKSTAARAITVDR